MSYLDGSYLADGEDFDADGATTPLTQAPGEYLGDVAVGASGGDVIVLPGGIVVPKKTLTVIALAVVIAVVVVYVMRQRDRKRVDELVEVEA